LGWTLVDEGRKQTAPRNAEDERHGSVMDLLFARAELRRLVMPEMKPPSSAKNCFRCDCRES
jgi:hypothetical protein